MLDILHPQTGTNFMGNSVASGGRMNVFVPRTEPGLLSLSAQSVILTNDTHIWSTCFQPSRFEWSSYSRKAHSDGCVSDPSVYANRRWMMIKNRLCGRTEGQNVCGASNRLHKG